MPPTRLSSPKIDVQGLAPSASELRLIFGEKYPRAGPNSGPYTRLRHGYYNPDDIYEALVAKLVADKTCWADVGCGRDIFPSNPMLAKRLSTDAAYLFGIDPDDNIDDNIFINDGFQGMIDDLETDRQFDLVTMRMVAEHIADPQSTIAKLAQITAPNGMVIVYTPNKWSPVELVTRVVPFRYHNRIKNIFWDTEERDTFPTEFKMNTRNDLARLFKEESFLEVFFAFTDDCRVTSKFRHLYSVEMWLRRMFFALNINYPENCLLGVYQKKQTDL